MSDTMKKLIVIVINLVAAGLLAFADLYGWDIGWYGAVSGIIVIVLDTWAGIEWIPPKRS